MFTNTVKIILASTALWASMTFAGANIPQINSPYQFAYWQLLGDPDFATTSFFQFALNGDNTPYVAFRNNHTATVMTLSQGNWMPVDHADFVSNINDYSMAVDQSTENSTPYFAYQTTLEPTGGQIIVDHLTNNHFASVGQVVDGFGLLNSHGLAVSNSGVPMIFYMHVDGYNSVGIVKKWDGSNWVQVGGDIPVNYITKSNYEQATDLSLTLDAAGNPYIMWEVNGQAHVMDYQNGQWTTLGTLNIDEPNFDIGFAVGPTGQVFIAQPTGLYYTPTLFTLKSNGSWDQYLFDYFDLAVTNVSLAISKQGTPYLTFHGSIRGLPRNPVNTGIYTVAYMGGHTVVMGNKTGSIANPDYSIHIGNNNVPVVLYLSMQNQLSAQTLN